jgi:hypothetical protein
MIRGIERRRIFSDDQDRENLIERLSLLLPETGTRCYSSFEPSTELQQKLYQAIKKAEFTEKDGQTTFTIKLTADRQVRLHWYYAPNSNIISPRRYLTKDGLITEPLIGMIDEETV